MNWQLFCERALCGGLLADRNAFRDLSSGFRGERAKIDASEITIVVVAAIAALAVFWALTRIARWREGRGPYHNPQQLFRKLCQEHGLDRKERQVLVQLSRDSQLPLPVQAFIRPDIFETATAGKVSGSKSVDLISLRQKVFGKLAAAELSSG